MKTSYTYAIGRERSRGRPICKAVLASLLLVSFCMGQENGSQTANTNPAALSRADKHKVIYVSDFELDRTNFKQDKGGITGRGYLLPPPPGSFLRRKRQDPATAGTNLVRLMSESLVSNLRKSGFAAQRLSGSEVHPAHGLIITGVFTELDEGNQMRRALLGFGSGKSKMQLYVMVTDASNSEQRLYEISEQKNSGTKPGSVIVVNPYIGAAGFVAKFGMTKNAPEKLVKKTASRISVQLAEQLNTEPLAVEQAGNAH